METATLRRPPALPALIQGGLLALLIGLAAVAWALTDDRMAGMDAGPGTDPGSLGWFIGVWVVMMAAMMFPSIAPMVIMFARIQEGRRSRGQAAPVGATPIFVGGYLISWAAAGLAGYAILRLGAELTGSAFSWDNAGPYLAGAVVVAAAVYQMTPLKDVCLRHCRNPLTFLMQHSRPGRGGALRMGIEHGGYCVGCCWALMAALFALGVMSIGWMAFIAALIALEKLLPWRELANRGIAVLLLVLGLGVAFVPEDVPGLTLPDSPEAAAAMESMQMEGHEGSMEQQMPAVEGSMEQMPGMDGEMSDHGPGGRMK